MEEFFQAVQNPTGILGILVVLAAGYGVVWGLIKLLGPIFTSIFKALKIKLPWVEIEAGAKTDEISENLVSLTLHMARKTFRIEKEIEAEQSDLIDDEYSNFRDFMSIVKYDPEVLWRHVEDALASSVKNNHMLRVVNLDGKAVDELYLLKKVKFIEARYMTLGINWTTEIENRIETFIKLRLISFAMVAKKKIDELVQDLEINAKTSGSKAIAGLVETLKNELGVK